MIEHTGKNTKEGHYIAYVREGESWTQWDDETSTAIPWREVKDKQAYILIWERSQNKGEEQWPKSEHKPDVNSRECQEGEGNEEKSTAAKDGVSNPENQVNNDMDIDMKRKKRKREEHVNVLARRMGRDKGIKAEKRKKINSLERRKDKREEREVEMETMHHKKETSPEDEEQSFKSNETQKMKRAISAKINTSNEEEMERENWNTIKERTVEGSPTPACWSIDDQNEFQGKEVYEEESNWDEQKMDTETKNCRDRRESSTAKETTEDQNSKHCGEKLEQRASRVELGMEMDEDAEYEKSNPPKVDIEFSEENRKDIPHRSYLTCSDDMSRHVLRNERRADRLATMEKKKSNSGG